METLIASPVIIPKENVSGLIFPKEDVLLDPAEQKTRERDLHKAMILGNNERYKVRIIFQDDDCIKEVDTTVWAATLKNVTLKNGTLIPIHRIHKVRFL